MGTIMGQGWNGYREVTGAAHRNLIPLSLTLKKLKKILILIGYTILQKDFEILLFESFYPVVFLLIQNIFCHSVKV